MSNFKPIMDKHHNIASKIMNALGVKVHPSSVIDFKTYLKILQFLKYYNASREDYLGFWQKFFNPSNIPEVAEGDMMESLELLARGRFTRTSTLISESFAKDFIKVLKDEGCVLPGGNIDMIDF